MRKKSDSKSNQVGVLLCCSCATSTCALHSNPSNKGGPCQIETLTSTDRCSLAKIWRGSQLQCIYVVLERKVHVTPHLIYPTVDQRSALWHRREAIRFIPVGSRFHSYQQQPTISYRRHDQHHLGSETISKADHMIWAALNVSFAIIHSQRHRCLPSRNDDDDV